MSNVVEIFLGKNKSNIGFAIYTKSTVPKIEIKYILQLFFRLNTIPKLSHPSLVILVITSVKIIGKNEAIIIKNTENSDS